MCIKIHFIPSDVSFNKCKVVKPSETPTNNFKLVCKKNTHTREGKLLCLQFFLFLLSVNFCCCSVVLTDVFNSLWFFDTRECVRNVKKVMINNNRRCKGDLDSKSYRSVPFFRNNAAIDFIMDKQ